MISKTIITTIIILLAAILFILKRKTWFDRMVEAGRIWVLEDDTLAVSLPGGFYQALSTFVQMVDATGRWKSDKYNVHDILGLCDEMAGNDEDSVIRYAAFVEGLDAIAYGLSLFRGNKDAKAFYDVVNRDIDTSYEKWLKEINKFLRYYDV